MLKSFLLQSIIKWLVGGAFFDDVKVLVKRAFDANISGEQKKEAVRQQLLMMGYRVSDFLINLAIESAVYVLKSKK